MKWIQFNGKELSIGFENASQAEAFLLSQSKNPTWIEQFQISFNANGDNGKLQAFITTDKPVTLHLPS